MHKLVIFDMDGVIFEHRNLWLELHKKLGTYEEGKAATDEWLYKDYDTLVDIVIHKLWKGKSAGPFNDLVANVKYVTGAEATVKALQARGYEVALITSGPSQLMQRAMDELDIEHGTANHLEIKNGVITGRSRDDDGNSMWPIQADNKVPIAEALCKELGFTMDDVVAVGDELNDLPLFTAAGMSIAFNAENEELKAAATHHVEGNDLRMILEYL